MDIPLFEAYSGYTICDRFDPAAYLAIAAGDCLESLRAIPDGSIQLVITSPPYNLGKAYEKFEDLNHYITALHPIMAEVVRVLKPGGSVCWQIGNYVRDGEVMPLDVLFYPAFRLRGLKMRNRIVWHFNHGLHATNRFSGRYEVLLWFTKGDNYIFKLDAVRVPSKYPGKTHFKGEKRGQPSGNPKGKNPSDIWELMAEEWERGIWEIPNVKSNHPEKTEHPCQFPIELAERCILALSNEDDWILDPFAGSGTVLLAALRQNRRGMACEKEIAYLEIQKRRIAEFYAGKLPYRPLGKPIHQPSGKEKVAQRPAVWDEGENS